MLHAKFPKWDLQTSPPPKQSDIVLSARTKYLNFFFGSNFLGAGNICRVRKEGDGSMMAKQAINSPSIQM